MTANGNLSPEAARKLYEQLLEERSKLPEQRKIALTDGDQAAYFRTEQRLSVIDQEILEAEATALRGELESLWEHAEDCIEQEEQLDKAAAARRAKAKEDHDKATKKPSSQMTEVERVELQLAAAKDADEIRELDIQHADARLDSDLALIAVDQAEERLEALTGKPAPTGAGLRARPPVIHGNVHLQNPVALERWGARGTHGVDRAVILHGSGQKDAVVQIMAGTRPPRWAARRITRPDVWEPPEDKTSAPQLRRDDADWGNTDTAARNFSSAP